MQGRLTFALVATSLATLAKGDFLNDYLFDKTFGVEPGPCPSNLPDEICTGDYQNLPENVKDIELCFLGSNSGCGKLGDIVKEGVVDIWELQCKRISVEDIELDEVSTSDQLVETDILVRDLGLACTFQTNVHDLKLSILSVFEITLTLKDAAISFPNSGSQGVVDLELQSEVRSDDFTTSMPDDLTLPVEECELGLDLGLDLEFSQIDKLRACVGFICGDICSEGEGCGSDFFGLRIDAILSAIVRILEGFVGGIICGVISQFAKLKDGRDGPINELINELKEYVDDLADTPEIDFDENEINLEDFASQAQIEKAFDLSESTLFEAASVGFNLWLGGESSDDRYDLVVNELANQVTGGDGAFETDLQALDLAPDFTLGLLVSNVTLQLNSFTVGGLDTFNNFHVLQNSFDPNNPASRASYTVENSFSLDSVMLQATIFTNLAPGEWVTDGTAESEFSFEFGIELRDLVFDSKALLFLNLDELDNIRIGQILQIPDLIDSSNLVESLEAARQCLAPAFYALHLGDLELSLSRIEEATVSNFDGDGLSQLIEDTVKLSGNLIRGALQTKLPGIARGVVREEINAAISEYFILPGRDGIGSCPEWDLSGPIDEVTRVNISGDLLEVISDAINSSVGGKPIQDTGTDINELIETLIEYFESTVADFPITRTPGSEQGDWQLAESITQDIKLPAFERPEEFLQLTGLAVTNLNSIYQLEASEAVEAGEYGGLFVGFGVGGALGPNEGTKGPNPLTFEVPLKLQSVEKGNEVFTLSLGLENVNTTFALTELSIALNQLSGLFISDAQHLPCILSSLKSLGFDDKFQSLQVESVTIGLDWDNSNSGGGSSTKIATALQAITDEIAQGGFPAPDGTFLPLLNSVLQGLVSVGLDEIETLPSVYEGLTYANCQSEPDPLTELFEFANPFPNITSLIDNCTAEVDFSNLPPIGELEDQVVYDESKGDVVYDLQDSVILDTVKSLLDTIFSQGSLETGLVRIANSTVDSVLANFLELDPEDPTSVNLILPLGLLGLQFESDTLAPGFLLEAQSMKLLAANKLLQTLDLLNPVGTFTTNQVITFPSDVPLNVVVEAIFEVDATVVDASAEPGAKAREEIDIEFEMFGFSLDMDLITAINPDALGKLSLGHFLQADGEQTFSLTESSLECGALAFYPEGLRIGKMKLEIGEINEVSLRAREGVFLSDGFEALFEAVTDIVLDFYKSAVTPIAQNCLVGLANDFVRDLQAGSICPEITEVPPPPLVGTDTLFRFNTSKDWASFLALQEEFLWDDEYQSINSVLEVIFSDATFFDKGEEDEISFQNIPAVFAGIDYGKFDLVIRNLRLENTGFSAARIGEPDSTERLEEITPEMVGFTTRTQLGTLVEGENPFGVQVEIVFNAEGVFTEEEELLNDLRIQFNLDELLVDLTLMAQVNLTEALQLQFSTISSLEELPCLLIPLHAFQVFNFDVALKSLSVDIECLETCTFPFLNELGDLEFRTEDGGVVADLVTKGVDFLGAYLTEVDVQQLIDIQLNSVEETCDKLLDAIGGTFDDPVEPTDISFVLALILLGSLGISSFGIGALYPSHRSRRKRVLLAAVAENDKIAMSRHESVTQDSTVPAVVKAVKLSMMSLNGHPAISKLAKFTMPCLLLIIVGLSLLAGLQVYLFFITLQLTLLGADTVVVALVPVTLESIINLLWRDMGVLLPLLLGLVAWAFPAIQVLTIGAIWYLPTTIFPKEKKKSALDFLQIIVKFSFVMLLIFSMLAAALYTPVDLKDYRNLEFLPEDLFAVELNMSSESGIALLVLAALVTYIALQLVGFYLERATNFNSMKLDASTGIGRDEGPPSKAVTAQKRLLNHVFSGRDRNGYLVMISPVASYMIIGGSALAALVIAACLFLPIITFEVMGIGGILLREISLNSTTIPSDAPLQTKQYSLSDLAGTFSTTPKDSALDVVRSTFLQLVFILVFVLAPIVQPIFLVLIMTMRMKLRTLRKILSLERLLFQVNCLDLILIVAFVVPFVISSLIEIYVNYISEQAVGQDFCYGLESTLSFLVPDVADAKCLSVNGTLEYGYFLYLGSFLIQFTCNILFIYFAHAAASDRYFAAYRNRRGDAVAPKLSVIGRVVLKLVTKRAPGPPATPSPQMLAAPGTPQSSQRASLASLGRETSAENKSTSNCCDLFCCTDSDIRDGGVNVATQRRVENWERRYGSTSASRVSSTASTSPRFSTNPTFSQAIPPSSSPPNPPSWRLESSRQPGGLESNRGNSQPRLTAFARALQTSEENIDI